MAKMPCPWGPLRTSKYRSCQSTGPDILRVRNRQASRNTSCLVTLPLPSFQNPAAKVPVFSKGSLEIIIGSAATKDMSLSDPNTKSTTNDHQKTNTNVITARRLFRCCWWKGGHQRLEIFYYFLVHKLLPSHASKPKMTRYNHTLRGDSQIKKKASVCKIEVFI